MKICLAFVLLAFCLTAKPEQPPPATWSSTACATCQSTIVYQAWYPDGSPLVAEGMSGTNAGALVAMSLVRNTLVLSLGLSVSRGPLLTLDLRESVTIETNSSTHMVLYAMNEPGPGFHKDDIAVLRSLNTRSSVLRPHVPSSGFLFFPSDRNASGYVVVVKVSGEIFRFPFAQDPAMHAKFGDPAKLASAAVVQNAPGSSQLSNECTTNVSVAVSEEGQLVARAPEFTNKWLEKNGRRYPGLCFSQTPNPRIPNYLIAFAPSPAAFDGFSPAVSAPNVAPASAQGLASDSRGPAWTYHFSGTAGGLTSTFVSLPFAEKTRTLYAFTYDQNGRLVSQRQRAVTMQRSLGAASNLGVSIAAAIVASRLKEQLLADAINDLTR